VSAILIALLTSLLIALPQPARDLTGTSWQLSAINGGDGKTVTPDDGPKYTIAFEAFGTLRLRVDCNRGTGNWKSPAAGQLTIGPLAVTRALCADSLSDRILKDIGFVQSYEIKGSRLIMSLGNDRGTYAWEPLGLTSPQAD